MFWRLVMKGVSLQEIEEYWDINDVYDANEVLDLLDEAEHRAMPRNLPPIGRRR